MDSTSATNLEGLLEESGLGKESVLNTLGSIMRSAEREETRLAAAKTGLQLNGLLEKDGAINIPVVNIIIRDAVVGEINPILIPR